MGTKAFGCCCFVGNWSHLRLYLAGFYKEQLNNMVEYIINLTGNEENNRRIFVYTFCLINICLSLSDDANKIKTLNIERA